MLVYQRVVPGIQNPIIGRGLGTSGGKRIPNAVNFVHSLRTTVKNSDSTAYDYNAISGYAAMLLYMCVYIYTWSAPS